MLETVSEPDGEGRTLLIQAAETLGLTARGYHRVLRVARTLADLGGSERVHRLHIAEALSLRRARSKSTSGVMTGQNTSKTAMKTPRNPFYS